MTTPIPPNTPHDPASVDTDEHEVAGASGAAAGVARESMWLFAGFVLTAGIGFLFWIVAARVAPAETLGVDAALLSLVTATASFTSSGMGNALVVMIGHGGGRSLIHRAYLICIVVGGVFGAAVGFAAHAFIVPHAPVGLVVAIMAGACILWSLMTLQGQAITGYGRAPITVLVNGPVNVGKLLLLSGAAALGISSTHLAFASTLVPVAIAVVVVAAFVLPRIMHRHEATMVHPEPLPEGTPGFAAFSIRDTAAVGLTLGLGLSFTFFVTALAGPAAGALFTICYQYAMLLDLLTVSVSTALARGASTRSSLAAAGFGVWLRTVAVVAAAAAAAVAASPIVFWLMGPEYDGSVGVSIVAALAGGSVLRCAYELWLGLQRARRHVGIIIVWNAIGAVVALAVVFLFTPAWGGLGAGVASLVHGFLLGGVGVVGLLRAREAR